MKTRFPLLILALAFALCACPVHARDGAGALSFIKAPISTAPQFAHPGGALIVDVAESVYNSCACRFHLFLDSPEGRVELPEITRVADPATGTYRFSAAIPEGMTQGLYNITAHKGGNYDTSIKAVFLVEEFPASFTVVHIHDPLVDENTGIKLELTAELAAKQKPAFILITGALTASNAPERVTRFLDILKKMPAPVFAASADPSQQPLFGALPRTIGFGEHAFLLTAPIDTQPGACAEQPFEELLKNREEDSRKFFASSHSLLVDSSGNTKVFITKPSKSGCIKDIQETVPPSPMNKGAVRIYSFENGRLAGHKLIPLPR
jgi:hypothetical protein